MKYPIGQVSIAVLLTVTGAIAVGVFTALTYVNSEVAAAVVPLQEQTVANQTAIAELNVNVSWIKSALQAKGFRPPEDPISLPIIKK